MKTNRRNFLKKTSIVSTGLTFGLPGISRINFPPSHSQPKKGPKDFIIAMGHYDIWEFNARFRTRNKSQNSPLRDFILPRLLEGGVNVVVMPPCGDSCDQRMGSDQVLEGSLRTIDMLLLEIEKTNGKASLILTKKDVPNTPDPNHVKFFFDMEGVETIQPSSEPKQYYPGSNLAILRDFFRMGVRGIQLTHDGRNMAAEGSWEGATGGGLSKAFGIPVIQECNRLGIMLGFSHCGAKAIFQAAEISTKPIVSTHQNPKSFFNNADLQHSDEEIKAIAATGGIVGMRYHSNKSTPYDRCADMIDYVANLVGIEHINIAWLGHDVENPSPDYVPGISTEPFPGGEVEKLTKYEQNSRFIDILYKHKYSDEHIAMVMGGNLLRVMKENLPE